MNSAIDSGLKDLLKETKLEQDNDVIFSLTLERLAETTFGYAISTLAGMMFLLFLLPQFYQTYNSISHATGNFAGFLDVMQHAFGISDGIVFLTCFSYLLGGWGLSQSHSWSKTLLKYLFLYTALIIAFEIRYAGFIVPDGQGMINLAVIGMLIVLCAGLFKAYKQKNLLTMRIFSILNFLIALFNIGLVMKMFISFQVITGDRHVQYLSLAIVALLLMQTIQSLYVFSPKCIFCASQSQTGKKNS
ncbi:MAG: hypothetical protein ACOYXC_19440 [Candidatus Rifleibacteriota bacterium]